MMRVEVVYALPEEQILIELEVEEGTTVQEAIERSGILARFPQIDPECVPLGIFGRLVTRGAPLRDGDRVEIYRPLIIDPKEARRKRVKPAKTRSGR